MASVIITAFNESKTIGRAIEAFLKQRKFISEIIVVAPDKATLNVAEKYKQKFSNINLIKDRGNGKPEALNLAVKKSNSEILILSDGDVFISDKSVIALMSLIQKKGIGCVTGRPISTNARDNIFGFWSNILTENFHEIRKINSIKNKPFIASGYLYAIKKNLMPKIPKNILADDAYVSSHVLSEGNKIAYSEQAKVFVNYPTNLRDWISQKKRTAGRIYQNNSIKEKLNELFIEMFMAMKSIRKINSFKEFIWFTALCIMRGYIWFRVIFDVRLWRRDFNKVWQRVESTKHIN